jgi:anaerobic magnesium-protoporphyrin IX monomethyl ester cyclase
MRILLFQPRGYDNAGGRIKVGSLAVNLPPVGLLTLAAVLRNAGHEVAFLDAARFFRVTNAEWARRIQAWGPDLVGFSAITPAFLDAYQVCVRVKEFLPEVRTVFGGAHVSWGRERILRDYPAIDALVAGEGENALRDLAAGAEPTTIAGLYWREGGVVRSGPLQRKDTLCCMDDLPFPAYDLAEGFPQSYHLAMFSAPKEPGTNIISSRGCVYQCSYCDRSVFSSSFRWNSPEYTFEQVQWLRKKFGIRHVTFYDDLFTLNQDRVARLCALLRQANLGVSFNCIVRAGHLNGELIQELKSAGCWMVHMGIESGDQGILDQHKDGLSLELIRRDVDRLHGAGLWVKGLFMMGFPGETEASIQRTIDFACSLPLKDANVTAFTPYPGAPIHGGIHACGDFDEDDGNWPNLDCETFVFHSKGGPDRATLERLYGDFLKRFYQRSFAKKVWRRMLVESPHSYLRLLRNLPTYLRFWFRKTAG